MSSTFPFKKEYSPLFGMIHRPIAEVSFRHKTQDIWQPVTMIVDTGADYTLLPRFLASPLGIDLKRDCTVLETQGVGGSTKVYLLKKPTLIKLGVFELEIPLGIIASSFVPPLLGRHLFLERFKVTFDHHAVTFDSLR